MSRRRKSHFLDAMAVVALSLLFGGLFSIVGIGLYEKDNPHIRQFDVDIAYSKGYSEGYQAALDGYNPYLAALESVPTPKASPTPAPTSQYAYFNSLLFERQKEIANSNATKEPVYREDYVYIGNKNSKIFHDPGCPSVEQMYNSNKVYLESRRDAIDSGYRPCKRCNP